MNRRRFIWAPAIALLLAGCSGVPSATLWHYRNFGPADFLKADPNELRAALQLEDGVDLGTKPPEVGVEVRFENRAPQSFAMPLEVLKQGPWVGAGAGKAEAGRHWYLLALSPAGVQAFRSLQRALARHVGPSGRFDRHGSLEASVATGALQFDAAARQRLRAAKKMYFQARLELSPGDGFYTLYQGYLDVSGTAAAGAKGGRRGQQP